MNYYYDCEFIEGFSKNRFMGVKLPHWISKPNHSIQLISISIVCEDGRVYSALSRDYNYDDASIWVRENVISPLYVSMVHGDARNYISENNFHLQYGLSNKEIAADILRFISFPKERLNNDRPVLYGYYSAYDHVLLCSLFGTMSDLPICIPMYTIDLQQMLYQSADRILRRMCVPVRIFKTDCKVAFIKANHPYFPKSKKEHNANSDAFFCKELHDFIMRENEGE